MGFFHTYPMLDTITVVWETYDCSDPTISPQYTGGYEYFDNIDDAHAFMDRYLSNNEEHNAHDVWYSAAIVDDLPR